MDNQPKCSHVKFWVTISLLVLFLCFSVMINIGLFLGISLLSHNIHFAARAEDEFPALNEIWSYGDGKVKAARITITGVISRSLNRDILAFRERDIVSSILRKIRTAKNDSNVKAIILEVDSPGGEITAVNEIYHALCGFRESDKNRKIIVFIQNIAASGGYYIAMASDWIIAEPTSVLGSIGVIIQTLNWKALSEKIGVSDVTIKSGQNKDLLNPFREVAPEQLDFLQDIVNSLYKRFVRIVQNNRKMNIELLQPLADGRVFTSKQALNLKLIDQEGYWEDVVKKTSALLGVQKVKIVKYEEKQRFSKFFSQLRLPVSLSQLLTLQNPRLMYLWRP